MSTSSDMNTLPYVKHLNTGQWISVWPDYYGDGRVSTLYHNSQEAAERAILEGGWKGVAPLPEPDPKEVDRLRLEQIRNAKCPTCGKPRA